MVVAGKGMYGCVALASTDEAIVGRNTSKRCSRFTFTYEQHYSLLVRIYNHTL